MKRFALQDLEHSADSDVAYALGPTGDLPTPYAVFHVEVDHNNEKAVDACYVHANRRYCQAVSRDLEGLVGRSYLEIGEGNKEEWLSLCYKALSSGETVSGFGYDSLVRDWICYSFSPAMAKDCCVYTLIRVPVDDTQRRQFMASTDARTSLVISRMLGVLSSEQSYEAAMDGVLKMLFPVIHAQRLCIFECSGSETKMTFELCEEGIEPQLGLVTAISTELLAYWFRNVTQDRVVLVPNVSIIERVSKPLYDWCRSSGISSLLATPFFNDGVIVGFLGAYNYHIDETIDLNRLFGAVSTFIAARIDNRRLIDNLKHASTHDTLTDLLNRRGARDLIEQRLVNDPEGSYVLALIDLDDFKRVNDVWGHGAGDEALRAMTEALRRVFTKDAILSRNGGDEFLALLWGHTARHASELLAVLTNEGVVFEHDGEQHRVSVSVGYARFPEQAHDMNDLFTKADVALYAVKLAGKSGFGKYTSEAEAHLRPQLGFSASDILGGVPYPLLVSRADPRGEILFASVELAHVLGYQSVNELKRGSGGSYAGIVLPDDQIFVRTTIGALSKDRGGKASRSFGFRAITKSGGVISAQATCRFVDIDGSGRVVYTVFSFEEPTQPAPQPDKK